VQGVKRRDKVSETAHRHYEICQNPWNGRCGNTGIALYIYHKGERLPICRECWLELADQDLEWGGNEPKHPRRLR